MKQTELIKGCKKGKGTAQKALYDQYASMMLGVCIRYIKDKDEAEHVMIGGMVKVFEKIGQFKEEGSFEGWIRRIMVNECLMYLRKNQAMSVVTDIAESGAEPDYDHLEDQIGEDALRSMIEALPVGYRTVFNLYAIEGYKHDEVSEMLGISVGTSKSQLNRARRILQKQLVEFDVESKKMMGYGK